MKKKNKGLLFIILGMICSLLFVAPLYVQIFYGPVDNEWMMLSLIPGTASCILLYCGSYIQKLEAQQD